ncbi:MAG: LytTR family DNA-binding domain-containing protein [Rhodospirillaceae bacterium]
MPGLTSATLSMHLLAALCAALLMAFVDAFECSKYFQDDATRAFVWAIIMLLGWTKVLLGCIAVSYLLGKRRPAGVLVVMIAGMVTSVPLAFEVTYVLNAMGPSQPIEESFWLTWSRCVILGSFFGCIGWCGIQRMPFLRPPVGWRQMLKQLDPEHRPEFSLSGGFVSDLGPSFALPGGASLRELQDGNARPAALDRPNRPLTQRIPGGLPAPVEAPAQQDAGEPTPDLRLARMPEGLDGSIISIESEDHYLRIRTNSGSDGLILGRLTDAAQELGEHAGRRVHRSWWVARSAVAGSERRGRSMILKLKDGREVPVARAQVQTLRSEGWLS